MLSGAKLLILKACMHLEGTKGRGEFVSDEVISDYTRLTLRDVRILLKELIEQDYIDSILRLDGIGVAVRLTPKGRLTTSLPPPSPPPTALPSPTGPSPTRVKHNPERYSLWYGTNRKPTDSSRISRGYTEFDDERLHYGTCVVSIPKSHKIGSLGSPWWLRLLRRTDDRLKLVVRH